MGGTRRYRMAVCAECGTGELVGQPGRCYHVVSRGTEWYVAPS